MTVKQLNHWTIQPVAHCSNFPKSTTLAMTCRCWKLQQLSHYWEIQMTWSILFPKLRRKVSAYAWNGIFVFFSGSTWGFHLVGHMSQSEHPISPPWTRASGGPLHEPWDGHGWPRPAGDSMLSILNQHTGWWYTYPSEKYESQLGLWHSQYMEKKHVPNHQPA